MNACKRFFALILSLCMVLSFVPVSAFAAETDGEAVTSSEQPPENQDIFVLGSDNTQGEVKVDHAEGVARVISEPNDNVDGLTTDEYVAYDIALYTDDAGTQPYEGDATISVSIPLTSELADAQQLRGFAVSEDGEMTYIDSVTVDPVLNTATFEVSPSATVGVTEAEVDADATSISLFVGDTYESTLPGVVLDSGNQTDATAAITWGGVPILEGVLKNADNDGQKVTMAQCEYFIEVTGKTGNNVDGNAVTLNADNQSRFIDPNSSGHWTDVCNLQFQFNDDDSVYVFKQGNNNYLYVDRDDLHWDKTGNVNNTGVQHSKFFLYAPVSDPSESSSELPGYKKVTEAADLVTGKYLIAFEDNDQNLYVMNAIVQGSESYKQMALVQISSNDSKITIRGLAEGNTTVDIGDSTYSVEVTQKVVDVDLFVGQSKTIPNVSGNYAAVDPQNPSIASVSTDVQLASSTPSGLSFVTSTFESGRKYVIVNYKSRQMVSNQTGTSTDKLAYNGLPGILANDPEYNFWTITATSDGKYTVQDKNDGYLTFTDNTSRVSDTEVKLTLRYSDTTGYWYVVNENSGYIYLNNRSSQPGGWATTGADNDNGNKHLLAEVVYDNTYTTDITFEGLTVGETSVMIGYTRYDITVKEELVNVTLDIGEEKSYTDNSGNYQDSYTGEGLDENIAEVTVAGTTTPERKYLSDAITAVGSGKTYVLYNKVASKLMNNEWADASVGGGGSDGLALSSAKDNFQDNDCWTITAVTGGYYVRDKDGKYLTIARGSADVVDTPVVVSLNFDGTDWTISVNGEYLNKYGDGATVAAGWNDANDVNSQWELYEVVTEPSVAKTTVTITGVAPGTTSVRVGGTRYNITVTENRKVQFYVGDTVTYTIEGVALTSGTVADPTVVRLDSVTNTTVDGEPVTSVTFTGLKTGKTTLTVGHVTFEITVNSLSIVDVELEVGESATYADKTGNYVGKEAKEEGFDDVANLQLSSQDSVSVNVASDSLAGPSLEDGTYIIVNDRAGKTMISQQNTAYAGAGTMTGMKLEGNVNNVAGSAVWTITKVSDGGYNVRSSLGTYLNIGNNTASLVNDPVDVDITYNDAGYWTLDVADVYLNDAGGAGTTAAGWTDNGSNGASTDAGSRWSIYKVETTTSSITNIVFKGVAVGTKSVVIGNTQYNVTVVPDAFENVFAIGSFTDQTGGQTDLNGYIVKKLTLSEGASMSLGVDIADPDSITATGSNGNISVTVNDNNTVTVTGNTAGDAELTLVVTKDGVSNTVTIPVHVTPNLGTTADSAKSIVCFYADEIVESNVYYAYYVNNNAVTTEQLADQVIDGHLIYLERPQNTGFGFVWLAGPTADHALTSMGATKTAGEYFPLHNGDRVVNYTTAEYYSGAQPSVGVENAAGLGTNGLDPMLQEAINRGMDGANSFSRSSSDNANIISVMSFVSNGLPVMNKVVEGVMGTSGLYADWRVYHPNMYAKVGEVVFFRIDITQKVPTVWSDEAAGISLLNIETANLLDEAFGTDAYFYTKELDLIGADTTGNYNEYAGLDGKVPEEYQTQEQNIKDAVNAPWTEAQKAAGERVLSYYVVYEIGSDADPKLLTNIADMSLTYKSEVAAGSTTAEAHEEASLYIVGDSMGDILLDFGLPVTIDDLDHTSLLHEVTDVVGCQYGDVVITQTEGAGDDDIYNDKWTITYTPHTVFSGYDVVYLDARDADGELVLKNYFRVYPASTIYYEESFANYGTANGENGPAVSWQFEKNGNEIAMADGKPVVAEGSSYIDGEAEYLYLGCTDPTHSHTNFGYSDKYKDETGMSNNSQAISKHSGDTATFTFSGTGVDIYANCDEQTSVMAVMIYKVDGDTKKLTKFYQVTSATKLDENDAGGSADSLPLVSVTNLDHGTYEVIVRHTKKMDNYDTKIRLDGFRVYNTLEASAVLYPLDERNPVFVDLRDEVLSGYTDLDTSTTGSQIFSESKNLGDVIYTTTTSNTDLLNKSPKNEIWLSGTETLSFKIGADVGFAQIGLKAPRNEVTVQIVSTIGDASMTQEYTIKTATDMFYRLPEGLGGATVTISVKSGDLVSVTKLKAVAGSNVADGSFEPLGVMNEADLDSVLDVIFDRKPTPIKSNVTRIYGDNRFETAFKVADELKTVLGVEKFENIIVASGTSFADALSGSYLATVKNAPILLSYDDTYDQMVRDYIAENLAENGTVYILGGEAAVAASMDDALISSGVSVKRLAGANRFDTNLAILAEAGVENEEILVCTGTNFADSLSASATGKPILLVYNESGKLTEEQAKYLAQLDGCTFTVIGGEAAVSVDLENAVAAYGTTKRIAGENRFQTSVAIAETYMSNPENVVLAYAGNYPDGLCGGVLAHAMQAPLVLTMTGYESDACAYVNAVKAKTGVILGGSGLISDNSIVNIFNLTDALEIIVK